MKIRYQKKRVWKYRLYSDAVITMRYWYPPVNHQYFSISGYKMYIKKDYLWDGASGIYDTKKTVAVSLPHDVGYQAIREGLLPPEYKKKLDEELKLMYQDRSSFWTSWMGFPINWGVTLFGGGAIKSDIIEAK